MNTYLRPLVSCRLYMTIIGPRWLSYKDGTKPVVTDKQRC